jgi:tetratricopeptide (TPR) repeat protein
MGKYEKAVDQFQRALANDPSDFQAYIGLAQAFEKTGRAMDVEQTYRRAIAVRPQYWESYFRLGTYYMSRSRYADAERSFDQVVSLAPDNVRGYNNLGAAYFQENKINEAAKTFEKSMSLRQTYQAASNLGTIYFYNKSDFPRAAAAYRKALSLNGGDYRVWGNLGAVLKILMEPNEARKAYQRAHDLAEDGVKLNPRDAGAAIRLASYTAELGNKEDARLLMDKALALSPDDSGVLFRVALLSEENFGDRDAALKWLSKAVDQGYPLNEIMQSPNLQSLRLDPRFKEIEKKSITKPIQQR